MANWNKISSPCILSFLFISLSSTHSHPIFNTKRFGRTSGLPPTHQLSSYPSLPLQPSSLNHFLAPAYYPDTPTYPAYSPDYDSEYFYPQEPVYNNYPLPPYYGAANPNDNMKFAMYQSMMPYYYDARRPGYGYPPVDDIYEEAQPEDRSDSFPVGQERWYDNSGVQQQQTEESMADVNAAFLQNLILSQMMENSQNGENAALRRQYQGTDDYQPQNEANDGLYYDGNTGYYSQDYEDDDVKDLKSLVKKTNEDKTRMLFRAQRPETILYGKAKIIPDRESWSKVNSKRNNFAYGTIISNPLEKRNWNVEEATEGTTSTVVPTTEAPDFDSRRGQKEVPMLRPAAPARRVGAVLEDADVRPKQSVYDSIKQLLNMEQALREDDETVKSQPQKRFVSNEASLVDQLGGLKKSAT